MHHSLFLKQNGLWMLYMLAFVSPILHSQETQMLMFASKDINQNYFWVLAPDKLYIIRMLCVSQWLRMFLLNPRRVRESQSAIVWIGAACFIILNQALCKHTESHVLCDRLREVKRCSETGTFQAFWLTSTGEFVYTAVSPVKRQV